MYCKHCGKQIADNSIFCQYCGSKQDDAATLNQELNPTQESSNKKVIEIPTIKTNFSDKTKWWIIGSAIWIVLNLYWLFAGDKYSSASEHFMPFYIDGLDNNGSYYDISEFIVYVIGLPFAVWGIMLRKKQNKDNASSQNNQK